MIPPIVIATSALALAASVVAAGDVVGARSNSVLQPKAVWTPTAVEIDDVELFKLCLLYTS
ncbi:MAG: hypothetical protein N2689_14880, partial [Verrucomicrobiae bacterium]|nr:hypothetical protein [Verrucomicrobiae bacterium]